MLGDNDKKNIEIEDVNEDDNPGDFEQKGKMNERLKKIVRLRRNKLNNEVEDTDNDTKDYGGIKRFFLIPVMFLGGFIGKKTETKNQKLKNDKLESIEKVQEKNSSTQLVAVNKKKWNNEIRNRRIFKKVNVVSKFDNILQNEIKNSEVTDKRNLKNVSNVDILNNNIIKKNKIIDKDKNKEVEELEKEILKLIKKRLIKLINEYEMLSSDFYVLRELLTDDIYYEKCLKNVKEIKKLLSKINSLKDKYDYLKDNIDFDDILELDDKVIQEKIIELKNKLNTDDLNYLVKDYKLLNEYQSLYLKVDKLQNDAYEYEKERKKKVDFLKEQKIDFEKFKKSIYNYESTSKSYNDFVKKQNMFINELSEKIGVIDSYEKVNYIFKNYRGLLFNSFKYMGLLLLSPLKGILPGIATQTIITKNILDNLKKSAEVEEKRTMVYEAINYEAEINRVVDDIDYMRMMIDSSLDDVAELKRKYNEQFRKNEGSHHEYYEAIKQLNKIENSIIGNRVKVDLMKERMMANRKVNDNTMVRVRKLNDNLK